MGLTKLRTTDLFDIHIGVALWPQGSPGGTAMRLKSIDRVAKPVFENALEEKADYISDNFKKVRIADPVEVDGEGKPIMHEYKVVVDDEFKQFLHPFYRLPQPRPVLDDLNQPVRENGQIVLEEESEETTALKDRYKQFIKVMRHIEADEKYKKRMKEIFEHEEEYNIPKLDYNDMHGVHFEDRSVLDYFESILKIK